MTDQQCAAEAEMACIDCCQTNHTSGIQALVMAIQSCACGTGGPCATTCASEYCANGAVNTTGDACDTCISNSLDPDAGGACLTPVETACGAGSACDQYLSCANGCP